MTTVCPTDYVQAVDKEGFDQCYPKICIDSTNNVCSKQGLCLTNKTGVTSCHCDKNLDPASQCSACADGLQPVDGVCSHTECLIDGKICSGNGSCTNNVCSCANNFDPESKCSQCVEGDIIAEIQGKQICTKETCLSADGGICANIGSCVDGTCQCFEGYDSASQCQNCDTEYTKLANYCINNNCVNGEKVCNNDGHCEANKKCVCREKYDPAKQCSECVEGYAEIDQDGVKTCQMAGCVVNNTICNNNGSCSRDKCSCQKNFDSATNCTSCQDGSNVFDGVCVSNSCITGKNICSGNGTCSQDKCKCENNFDPENQCSKCMAENTLLDGTCVPTPCVSGKTACSNKGTCTKNICVCTNNLDPAQQCSACVAGKELINEDCVATTCIISGKICSGNGTCKNDVCQCNENFGTDCAACLENFTLSGGKCIANACIGEDKLICGGTGTCTKNICVCTNNLDPAQQCSACAANKQLINEDCVATACIDSGVICNGNGICKNDACECSPGFQPKCDACEGDLQMIKIGDKNVCTASDCLKDGVICANNGTCDLTTKACKCKENFNNDCTTCLTNFTLVDQKCIANACVGDDKLICGGNGTCKDSTCACSGNQDPAQKCKTGTCATGFTLVNGVCVSTACLNGSMICNNHGDCTNNKCVCSTGYSGSQCVDCANKFSKVGAECFSANCIDSGTVCNAQGNCAKPLFSWTCQCKGWLEPTLKCKDCGKTIPSLGPEGKPNPIRCIPKNCRDCDTTKEKPKSKNLCDVAIATTECSGRGSCINDPILALAGVLSPKCSCKAENMDKFCLNCKANFILYTYPDETFICAPSTCTASCPESSCLFDRGVKKFICRCPTNYDPAKGCSDCLNQFDIKSNCLNCKTGFSEESACSACKYGYRPNAQTGFCDSCHPGFDIQQDCRQCLGGLTIRSRCKRCENGFTFDGESCVSDLQGSVAIFVVIGVVIALALVITIVVFVIRYLRKKSERRFMALEQEAQELNESMSANEYNTDI